MKIIINENERGLLLKNGQFVNYLKPGKFNYFASGYSLIRVSTEKPFQLNGYNEGVFLKNRELREELVTADVPDESFTVYFKNDKYFTTLFPGHYYFFEINDKHEFQNFSTKEIEVAEDFPRYLFTKIPAMLYTKIEVAYYQKARLSIAGVFDRILEPGTYYFWNNGTKFSVDIVDTRLLQLDITGQEMLTLDKVPIRVNFVCNYKITDYVKIASEIGDYEKQLHILIQLILREYVGQKRLDELLAEREEAGKNCLQKLREKEAEYFVKFTDAGVKDFIIPGEIRSIMNTVLLAEKRAQANIITRREEVASTRSLLNTAKLMDENKTLYKLKELELIEKICDNVGNISLSSNADILTQLTGLLKTA
jgi:regulator of protease activity HflC (stomatin/prohibitin superfamily)